MQPDSPRATSPTGSDRQARRHVPCAPMIASARLSVTLVGTVKSAFLKRLIGIFAGVAFLGPEQLLESGSKRRGGTRSSRVDHLIARLELPCFVETFTLGNECAHPRRFSNERQATQSGTPRNPPGQWSLREAPGRTAIRTGPDPPSARRAYRFQPNVRGRTSVPRPGIRPDGVARRPSADGGSGPGGIPGDGRKDGLYRCADTEAEGERGEGVAKRGLHDPAHRAQRAECGGRPQVSELR